MIHLAALLCGVSVFPRTEAIFLQSNLFARCFGLGPNFYALAVGFGFAPGIMVRKIP